MNDSYNIWKLFEEMELYLVKSLRRNFKRHEKEQEKEGFKWEMWQKAKLRGIKEFRQRNREIVNQYRPEVSKIANETIDRQYQKGQVQFPADLSHRKPETPAPQEKNFFHVNDKKIEAMKRVVNDDLKKGQHAVLRKMDDVYRKTVYAATVNMAAGVLTLDQAIDTATKDFLDQGINCIEYSDGKRVNIASYAEMCLRTASHRATLLGEGKKRDEWGIHTVVVSAHANTCPHCEKWQGMVLVDDVFSGGTLEEAIEGGYYLLSFAIAAGLLHPNCRHTLATYFPGVTQIPKIPDGREAVKKYEAEQGQRRLERLIRKWKRVAEGSQSPDNVKNANAEVRNYQQQLREHLGKHTYLRRAYNREKNRR